MNKAISDAESVAMARRKVMHKEIVSYPVLHHPERQGRRNHLRSLIMQSKRELKRLWQEEYDEA